MFREIGKYLSSQGLTGSLIFLLWMILHDEKTLERIKKKNLHRLIYIGISGYLLFLALSIVRIVMKHSG